jgi:hypothetical protein
VGFSAFEGGPAADAGAPSRPKVFTTVTPHDVPLRNGIEISALTRLKSPQ